MNTIKPYFGINLAIRMLVDSHRNTSDKSATTIRCALNDILDAASKNGNKVNFNFNQGRTVKICQNKLKSNLRPAHEAIAFAKGQS